MQAVTAAEPGTDVGIVAHRGASGYAPENTSAVFDLAIDLSATAIEIDVRMTRDGHLIVWHDETIGRTARTATAASNFRVRDLTLDELRGYEVGSWFNRGYPLLAHDDYEDLTPLGMDEVLADFGSRLPLFIEPKEISDTPAMVRELSRSLGVGPRSRRHAVLAHEPRSLEAVLIECPEIEPVLLVDRMQWAGDLGVAAAARLRAGISPHKDLVDARLVAHAHHNDVAVYPHTVNHPGEIRRLVELGVDAVITDLPDHALFVLGQMRVREATSSQPA
jgi:glycerophosphoryl diester phosphodiesterase